MRWRGQPDSLIDFHTGDGRAAATSVVAYDESRRLAGFAAATAADEPFNNLGPLVEWKTFFDLEDGRDRCLLGPICAEASVRGSGLFQMLVPRPLRRAPRAVGGSGRRRRGRRPDPRREPRVAHGAPAARRLHDARRVRVGGRPALRRPRAGPRGGARGTKYLVATHSHRLLKAAPQTNPAPRGPPRPWSRSSAT